MHAPARLAAPLLAVLVAVVLAACATGSDVPDDADARGTGGAGARDYGTGAVGAELQAAIDDVSRVAPALERLYRGGDYPRSLDQVVPTLDDAGEELADGNRLGAYRYDPDAVEFVLCVEHEDGAWATYDTAPMTTGRTGEGGGCPQL